MCCNFRNDRTYGNGVIENSKTAVLVYFSQVSAGTFFYKSPAYGEALFNFFFFIIIVILAPCAIMCCNFRNDRTYGNGVIKNSKTTVLVYFSLTNFFPRIRKCNIIPFKYFFF